MLPRVVSNVLLDLTEAIPGQVTSSHRVDSGTQPFDSKSPKHTSSTLRNDYEMLACFYSSSVLQTRRLMGDTSRKGELWWKCCRAHPSTCSKLGEGHVSLYIILHHSLILSHLSPPVPNYTNGTTARVQPHAPPYNSWSILVPLIASSWFGDYSLWFQIPKTP